LLEKAIDVLISSAGHKPHPVFTGIQSHWHCVATENGPHYSMTQQGAMTSHFLIMECFLVDNGFLWSVQTVLRVHVATKMETALSLMKYCNGSISS
jgi:hypothetical protein